MSILFRLFYLVLFVAASSCTPSVSTPAEGPYLLVLGTAQDAGYPQAACNKSCCRAVSEGQRPPEQVSCVAIIDPATRQSWMLDATPNFTTQLGMLEREGYALSGIFPTHAHIGHYTGLMYLGHEAMGSQHMPVYVMPRLDTFLRTNGPWSQLVTKQNIDLRPLKADIPVSLSERLRITPFRVPHRDEYSETVGFRVDGPTHSVIYLPDIDKWSRWNRNIDSLVRTVDYALLDATFYDGNELPGRDMTAIPHPFVVESMERFASLPKTTRRKIFFTHFNHTNPLLQEDSEATQAVKAAGLNIARTALQLPL